MGIPIEVLLDVQVERHAQPSIAMVAVHGHDERPESDPMAQPAWSLTNEPETAAQLRQSLGPAGEAEADFWRRQDLTYLGDLDWCQLAAMRGLEYLANVQVSEDQITYQYGLINLDQDDAVAGSLVCDVRARREEGYPFEMQINGDWLPGPLQFWLDQLAPDVQDIARERYRLVIAWAERSAA